MDVIDTHWSDRVIRKHQVIFLPCFFSGFWTLGLDVDRAFVSFDDLGCQAEFRHCLNLLCLVIGLAASSTVERGSSPLISVMELR
jgi:hypothetical protein